VQHFLCVLVGQSSDSGGLRLPVKLASDENHYCLTISGGEQSGYAKLMNANPQNFWFVVSGGGNIEAPAEKKAGESCH
jgi:hypothetical protein